MHHSARARSRRLTPIALSVLLAGGGAVAVQQAVSDPQPAQAAAEDGSARSGTRTALELLTDPFLQLPTADSVNVVWFTEWAGEEHTVHVGGRTFAADTRKLSRVAEDSGSQLPADEKPTAEQGVVARDVFRHEAKITGLRQGEKLAYRVVSTKGARFAASGTYQLTAAPAPGTPQRILLTSDHQAMVNTPANLEMAAQTIGRIDAVFLAGDLVNVPDRASEWFDDTRGSAFFPVLQGRGGRASTHGEVYRGAPIIQNAPLFPAVGNHEVQGAREGQSSLGNSFNAPVPRAIVERAYAAVASQVNPRDDPAVKAKWIEDRSFSTATYEEIFSLPSDSPGGETYYAITLGDVRMISLYSTRIWRSSTATADPARRTAITRYHESTSVLDDQLRQGWGEHIFEAVKAGSPQLRWLERELASPAFRDARYRVVVLHEGPQGLGDNIMPVFSDPVKTEERDANGRLTGIRYEYPTSGNGLLRDLQPMLEQAGVDLVQNGHSHLWNRFTSAGGTNFIETSNTGNTYGAFHQLSGRTRPVPPAPWLAANYLTIGNPGGLAPILPSENPMLAANGEPMPFVQSNDHNVFTVLDTGANEVVSYIYDVRTPEIAPKILDRFSLGRPATSGGEVVPPALGGDRDGGWRDPAAGGTTRGGDAAAGTGTADAPAAGAAGAPLPSRTTAASSGSRYGVGATVEVSVAASTAPSGTVAIARGGRALASGRVRAGAATVTLHGTALKPGTHKLTVRFSGGDAVAASSTTVAVQVRRATPKLRAAVAAKQSARRGARLRVAVTAPGLNPRGAVRVLDGTRTVGSAQVRGGRATVALDRFATPGVKRLKVVYGGDGPLDGRSAAVRLQVR
ncbi:Ig-like domain repeat protein [Conexibacter sp. JD483]|uniref:Ig-like domain repeat protein n=1 Tax=unclassified Conexibacter TaxID=2627773 RepID=UPI00271749CD|nr:MULTISPECIES: Ig-like domain repeat protein [unclassified Conexibacter]MDO8188954.1 Ig-like domain repeat protein [Conexibacter sp. CPCC 205706]MDO8201731.1 Ig-like domain repeat protein [Conexibacter sp. CPCC 205762]MDR9371414.1 Ig-like domain repeat protein [Conexibacter sp. JD483]